MARYDGHCRTADCRAKTLRRKNANPRYAELYRHYPTIDYLRRGARRRLPHFSFEYSRRRLGKDDAGDQAQLGGLDAWNWCRAMA